MPWIRASCSASCSRRFAGRPAHDAAADRLSRHALHRERLMPVDVAEILDGTRRGDAGGDAALEHTELLLERERVAVDHADGSATDEERRAVGEIDGPASLGAPRAGG